MKIPFSRLWLVLCLVLLVPCSGSSQQDTPGFGSSQITVYLASGMSDGTYYRIARLADSLSVNRRVRIRCVETDGSWESLNHLRQEKAQFALAQWDAVIKFINLTPDSTILAIRPLYTEYLHIVIRQPLDLLGISEVAGKRVYIGPNGSGTSITSRTLLDLLGISPAEYVSADVAGYDEVLNLLQADSLDIAMYVGPLGSPLMRRMLLAAKCRLLPLTVAAKRRLTVDIQPDQRLPFTIGEIPGGTYGNQRYRIATIATAAMLVGLSDIPVQIISEVDATIQDAMDSVGRMDSRLLLKPVAEIPNWSRVPWWNPKVVPRSAGMLQFWLNIVALLLLVLLAVYLFRRHVMRTVRFNRNRTLVLIAGSIGAICLMCAVGIYAVEHTVNIHFESLYETGWSMLVYLTSGLEDRAPITAVGRVLGSILLLSGPAFLAVVTGFLASSLVVKALEKNMAKNLKGHYVILNWGPRTMEIIKQIHSPVLGAASRSVIVVVSDDPHLDLEKLQRDFKDKTNNRAFEDVYFHPGDPTDEFCLLNANVEDAEAVVVMAKDNDRAASDEAALRTLFTLKRIAENHNIRMHVVVELLRIANTEVLKDIARDFPGTVDSVAVGQMRTMLLAQATLIPGLTDFYKDLLNFSDETNEVYLVKLPDSVDGQTFPEYCAKVVGVQREWPLIPVGILRNTDGIRKLITNPKPTDAQGAPNPYFRLRRGDSLLVIAYETPQPTDVPE